MLANQLMRGGLRVALAQKNAAAAAAVAPSVRLAHGHGPVDFELEKIGNREVVGYGLSGQPNYHDRPDYPFPAIRFRRSDEPGLQALREKEKGDWKKLTQEEKKTLYRASFCQTFAEFDADTGEWKSIVGWTAFFVGVSIWVFYGVRYFGWGPLPKSMDEEYRTLQLQRMLDAEVGIIEGLASKYDYDKKEWKK